MKKQLLITADGSNTIAIPEMHVTYRSTYGAVQESTHVFIEAGLKQTMHQHNSIRIFEMGFGTGLNTLLSCEYALQQQQKINYCSIELFPLSLNEVLQLNYNSELLEQIHTCKWDEAIVLNEYFTLHKINQSLLDYSTNDVFDLIYFDAFDPNTQPELWTYSIFKKLFNMLDNNGILVTYSSKGDVRRALLQAGFNVDKLAGPPGKREMIRARKATVLT